MTKKGIVQRLRKWHKWPGIIISLIAIHFALSGIVMNHRPWVAGLEVSRKWLPDNYAYGNWDMAAIKGGIPLGNDSLLCFGNVGCWVRTGKGFMDFNAGFPRGIDHRKIMAVVQYNNKLVAATPFGLYARPSGQNQWQAIPIPGKPGLSDLLVKQDTLLVLSRDLLFRTTDLQQFESHMLPPPTNYTRKAGLFRTLWELHSGELWGLTGKLLVDLLGLVTIFLSISGIVHFIFPKWMKQCRKKGKNNQNLSKHFRWNLKKHNQLGYIFAVFLLINTVAGMFLRPPLLIPIMNKQVGILPGTHLDTPNPWYDKLRKGVWNDSLQQFIFSTSDGFYTVDANLQGMMKKMHQQPPVSVMGCNVLLPVDSTRYLVGSFSGLFLWDPLEGKSVNFFTHQLHQAIRGGRPVSDHMVTGLIHTKKESWYFDYRRGIVPITNSKPWTMPQHVKQASPISLWNLALEMHTGRIFEFALGMFYFLYVPLAGICLLTVVVSGFLVWYFAHRKNPKKAVKTN